MCCYKIDSDELRQQKEDADSYKVCDKKKHFILRLFRIHFNILTDLWFYETVYSRYIVMIMVAIL